MQRWEYNTVLRTRPVHIFRVGQWEIEPKEMLTEMGEQGWELVAISAQSGGVGAQYAGVTSEELWVFKRPA
jgi:hypothetical protein